MTTKISIIIGITAVLITGNLFVLYYYVYDSQPRQIEILLDQLGKARDDLTVSQTNQKRERKKSGEEGIHHRVVQQDIRRVLDILPHVFSITEYAGSIATMIDKHRLSTAEGLLFTPEKSNRLSLTKYTTNIAAKGQYRDIKAFIAELGMVPELLCMERIRFKRSGDTPDVIELTLAISIYFRGDVNSRNNANYFRGDVNSRNNANYFRGDVNSRGNANFRNYVNG